MKSLSCSLATIRIMLALLFVTAPLFSPYDSPEHTPLTRVESHEMTLSSLVAVSPISKFAKDKQTNIASQVTSSVVQPRLEHASTQMNAQHFDARLSGRAIVMQITRSLRT